MTAPAPVPVAGTAPLDLTRDPPELPRELPRDSATIADYLSRAISGSRPGSLVALEMPGGLTTGRLVDAEIESRYDFVYEDTLNDPVDDPTGLRRPLDGSFFEWRRPGDPAIGRPNMAPAFRPTTNSHRMNLRFKLDEYPRASLDLHVEAAARRVAELIEERQVEQVRRANMVTGTFTAGLAGTGLYTTAYPTAAGTTPETANTWFTSPVGTTTSAAWGDVTLESIRATMDRLREVTGAATAAPTRPRVWYGTPLQAIEAVDWTVNYTPTTGAELRASFFGNLPEYNFGGVMWPAPDEFNEFKPAEPETRLRQMIRSRMAPAAVRHRDVFKSPTRPGLSPSDDFRELRARETLAKLIGEEKFRRFVRDGFVTLKAKSGRVYQIFTGGNFTRVYLNGTEENRLCVVLKGQFPPTDSVIVRYLMLLNDEEGFRKQAVDQGKTSRWNEQPREEKSLAAAFADYKKEYDGYLARVRARSAGRKRIDDAWKGHPALVSDAAEPVAAAG